MTAKSDAFADVEASYIAFRDQFVMLEDDDYRETFVGDWNLSQMLAHLAGWYRELAPELERILNGKPTPDHTWSDADGWNARFIENALYGSAALDDFDLAFHDFYAAAKAIPEEAWGTDASGKTRPVEAFFRGLAIGHVDEHEPEIAAWLARR